MAVLSTVTVNVEVFHNDSGDWQTSLRDNFSSLFCTSKDAYVGGPWDHP